MQTITCSDTECKYNTDGSCTAGVISHTSDRFCVTGRRRPSDDTPELMQTFKSGCRKTQAGYRSKHGKVLK